MKRALLLTIILFAAKYSFTQAVEGKVEYQKSQQPAAIVELPYSPAFVESSLRGYLEKKGAKGEEIKGFQSFRNVRLGIGDTALTDMYFKIDQKSRQEKEKSIVYLVVAKPNENVATRSGEDRTSIDQAKAFLDEFVPSIESYNSEVLIRGQEENIKKAEKKYNALMEEAQELEKRKQNIEQKILENKQHQEKQRSEVDREKSSLQTIISKKRG